ncbi:MAG: Gfo/Idh/MocA family oxidoreductase [Bacteroidota bacterium]|nr:Gfo/Idh/MocA family oxidoreductase [Bacteroidota bacterium]
MTINWGILSTAHINRRIIPAIQQSGRATLHAVASRDIANAQTYAKHWKIPVAYGSYENLLANPEIDVVYISLPNHLHTEWILKSLDASKHVLCEKPISLNPEDIIIIEEMSRRTGKLVMEGAMHLYHPQTELWKSIISEGKLGDIHSLRSCFSFNLDRDPGNYRWDATRGGGALWDVGVYPISLFQFLLGEKPFSGLCTMYEESGIDLSTSAILQYKKGVTGLFFVSFRSEYSTETIIHGQEGQLQISHPYNNADLCEASICFKDTIEKINVPREYLYTGEVEAMHDWILNGKRPAWSLADSHSVITTILSLRERKF